MRAAPVLSHGPGYPGGGPGSEEEEDETGDRHPYLGCQSAVSRLVEGGRWKVEGGRCPYLEVRVRVSTEDDDEEAADGETLDTEPDWQRTVLHTLSVPHVTSLPHLAL